MRISQENKLNFITMKNIILVVVLEAIVLLFLINNQLLYLYTAFLVVQFGLVSFYLLKKLDDRKYELENYKQKLEEKENEHRLSLQEFHTANEELKSLNSELVKSKKELEELSDYRGRFLVNMSHELRTPLNSIIGFSTIMLDDSYELDKNEYLEMMDVIHNSSKKLLTLVNNILDLTKVETSVYEPKPEYIDISNALSALYSVAKGMLKNNSSIILNYKIEDNLPRVYADEKALNKALNNILDNAVKFTKRGEITLKAYKEESRVTVEISDTGIGINKEIYDYIFEPFTAIYADSDNKTLTEKEGAGIGLALSKFLLEKMNADLSVDSEENQGTSVKVFLNIKEENA